jgi:glucose-6-phosphate-specific signal transduction histidine kinase
MTQHNIPISQLSENSIADVLQQELAQRLLAIRMSAALYSRRNEGRKTQELADQTVTMADELIQLFESLMTLMRLPNTMLDDGFDAAINTLQVSVRQCSPLRCTIDNNITTPLSNSAQHTLFLTLYHSVLQLMLNNGKIHPVHMTLDVDTATGGNTIVIHHPEGAKALSKLHASIEQQGVCSTTALDQEQTTLRLELAAPAQQ